MTAPGGGNAIDSDMAILFAGPLGAALCAKKVYGWFKEGRGPEQTFDTGHEVWSKVSAGQVDVTELINKAVRDSGAVWGGSAADGMRSSTSPLGSWADSAGATATAGSTAVANLSGAYRTAQNSVQKPIDVPDKPWYNDGVPWDTDYDEALGKSQGVDNANMQALNTYAVSANSAMSGAPKFESPNSSTANVQETPPPPIDQPKQHDGYHGKTSTSSVDTMSTTPGSTPNNTTTPSWTAPPAIGQNTPNLPNTPTPGGNLNQPGVPLPGMPLPPGQFPGNQKPGPNSPGPGTPGGKPGMPGGPGGSRGPGGMGGPGAAGAARGPGGVGGVGGLGGAQKPGSFGPLGSGGSAGVLGEQGRGSFGPSSSSSAGAAGGRGAAGAGGMGAGGAGAGRGEGADDLEHTSKYVEPNDEAFGDDRTVAPPVIGE